MSIGSLFEQSLLTVWTVETFSLRFRGDYFLIQKQNKFGLHHWQYFASRSMATLRNKRKLAAVSRETPEGSRSSRTENVLDPELTQDYISQVSEEIEGRVTMKLYKEFSKTESHILGALSKLDEFLLNPQVRTCYVAVPGTSRNTNLENRETTGDRSSDDLYPEVGYFSHHSGQLNGPETKTNPHRNQLGISPRMIPIPKWSSLFVGPVIQLTQTRWRPLNGAASFQSCCLPELNKFEIQKKTIFCYFVLLMFKVIVLKM